MADNETTADIIAEMRRHIAVKMSDAWYTQEEWRKLCDRLEAAHRRECGDVSKLREALKSCLDFIMRLDRAFNPFMQKLLEDAIAKAEAALAEPARNCDRFADETDAQIAFLNEVWLISVTKENLLERDRFENWTDEMKSRYAKWLLEVWEDLGRDSERTGNKAIGSSYHD